MVDIQPGETVTLTGWRPATEEEAAELSFNFRLRGEIEVAVRECVSTGHGPASRYRHILSVLVEQARRAATEGEVVGRG